MTEHTLPEQQKDILIAQYEQAYTHFHLTVSRLLEDGEQWKARLALVQVIGQTMLFTLSLPSLIAGETSPVADNDLLNVLLMTALDEVRDTHLLEGSRLAHLALLFAIRTQMQFEALLGTALSERAQQAIQHLHHQAETLEQSSEERSQP